MPPAQPQRQAVSSTTSNLHCKPPFLTASKSFWFVSPPKHICAHGASHQATCPKNLEQLRARSKQTGKHLIHRMGVDKWICIWTPVWMRAPNDTDVFHKVGAEAEGD